jgi:sec-independent protein translocase protein TatC
MEAGNATYHQLTFSEHVSELRKRLAWSGVVFMAGGFVAYAYHSAIIQLLKRPFGGPLYYDTPAGNFNLIMEISFMVGFAVAVPVIVFNIIRFVEPAIEKRVRHHLVISMSLLSLVLGVSGATFAYFIVLPISLHFFQGFKVEGVSALISAQHYLDFVVKCIGAFILIFQIPLGVLFGNFVRPIPPRTLLKYEKHVVIGSLIIALLLPFTYDPLTQFVIALPIIFLYNLSLLLVWIINRRAPKIAGRQQVESLTEETQPAVVRSAPQPTRAALPQISPVAAASVPAHRPRNIDGFRASKPTPKVSRATSSPRPSSTPRPPVRGRYLDVAGNTANRRFITYQTQRPAHRPAHFLDLRPANTEQEPGS